VTKVSKCKGCNSALKLQTTGKFSSKNQGTAELSGQVYQERRGEATLSKQTRLKTIKGLLTTAINARKE